MKGIEKFIAWRSEKSVHSFDKKTRESKRTRFWNFIQGTITIVLTELKFQPTDLGLCVISLGASGVNFTCSLAVDSY
jgi:hypothetical protein